MREEISLTDCPQILQNRVQKVLQSIPGDIISVQKWQSTPYKDNDIVMSDYRVFLQYGYEVAIYKTYVTTGGGALDGEVYSTSVNGAELEIIATKAKWIGEDLRNLLNKPVER